MTASEGREPASVVCGAVMPASNPPGRFVCHLHAPHPDVWHCASMDGVVAEGGLAFWRDEPAAPTPSSVPASSSLGDAAASPAVGATREENDDAR